MGLHPAAQLGYIKSNRQRWKGRGYTAKLKVGSANLFLLFFLSSIYLVKTSDVCFQETRVNIVTAALEQSSLFSPCMLFLLLPLNRDAVMLLLAETVMSCCK